MHDDNASIEITRLLDEWRGGDKSAEQRLMAVLYPALRAIACRAMQRSSESLSLRATELAHEAYLRLVRQQQGWQNRSQFFAIAARVTRYVLIDLLRERDAEKRGADVVMLTLEIETDSDVAEDPGQIEWLALEQSLQQLERRDAIAARVVELRYFGGLNNDEVAQVLDIGTATVVRHWKFARAWLHRRL